jgi:hypothetical protein
LHRPSEQAGRSRPGGQHVVCSCEARCHHHGLLACRTPLTSHNAKGGVCVPCYDARRQHRVLPSPPPAVSPPLASSEPPSKLPRLLPPAPLTREYVVRPRGHSCDAKYLAQKPQPRLEGAVWLWGCFCADGLGHAELYDGTLDAAWYQRLLSLNLVKSAHTFWPIGQWWYQQDNASPHTAGTTRAWFHNHGVDVIDFPPWSGDLNPIENLWNDLKRRVYARHPQTMEELELFIREEWAATSLDYCRHTCLSMPRRLRMLIENKGHKVRY